MAGSKTKKDKKLSKGKKLESTRPLATAQHISKVL
jgi:hypothetical protein